MPTLPMSAPTQARPAALGFPLGPWLVLGLPAGALVDRVDPRLVMITADLVAAGAVVAVPLAWCLGRLSLVQLLVVALTGGVTAVFFRTAYVKLLPLIVADTGLEPAIARLYGTESAMQVAGPGSGRSAGACPARRGGARARRRRLSRLSRCLRRIRTDRIRPAASTAEPLRARIAEGVKVALGDRLRALMIIGGVSNFGLTEYAALGVRPTILAMAGLHLVACLSILGTRIGRGRELPVRTDA